MRRQNFRNCSCPLGQQYSYTHRKILFLIPFHLPEGKKMDAYYPIKIPLMLLRWMLRGFWSFPKDN